MPLKSTPINALEKLAFRAFSSWQLARADRLLTRVLELDENRPYAHYLMGETLRRSGEWSGALKHFQRAVETGRRDSRTIFRLAESAWRSGMPDAAQAFFADARRVAQADGDARTVKHIDDYLTFISSGSRS